MSSEPRQPRRGGEKRRASPRARSAVTSAREGPSSWGERLPGIGLAVFGFGISAYLASVELGYLPHAWEPFFHGGSDVVLHSSIAHALPVPDAVLGAFGYLAEAITGAVGGSRRFDTAPWQPLLYGALALLMALVGATLLVLQPAVIHAACTLCVVSAATSIAIAFNAYPEVRAALRTVRAARRAGRPLGAALRGERSPSIG